MVRVVEFRPVKDLQTFEQMYGSALDELKSVVGKDFHNKICSLQLYKKDCIFNKKIIMYYKNNECIGFCMYEIIEHVAAIILDFVDKRFKGCGRMARILVTNYFREKFSHIEEIIFSIHKNNHLSINSIKKIEKKCKNIYFKQETNILSDRINFTAVFL